MRISYIRRLVPRKYRLLFTVLILLIGLVVAVFPRQSTTVIQTNTYAVLQVHDGDTIEVDMNGRKEKVRLIGVDTPETQDPRKPVQCFGKSASTFTSNLLRHKRVRLEADPLSTNRDRYDRLLRYVYVEDVLVNAALIEQGYGFAYVGFPFTKSIEFKALQAAAESNKRGLWNECEVQIEDNGQVHTNDS